MKNNARKLRNLKSRKRSNGKSRKPVVKLKKRKRSLAVPYLRPRPRNSSARKIASRIMSVS